MANRFNRIPRPANLQPLPSTYVEQPFVPQFFEKKPKLEPFVPLPIENINEMVSNLDSKLGAIESTISSAEDVIKAPNALEQVNVGTYTGLVPDRSIAEEITSKYKSAFNDLVKSYEAGDLSAASKIRSLAKAYKNELQNGALGRIKSNYEAYHNMLEEIKKHKDSEHFANNPHLLNQPIQILKHFVDRKGTINEEGFFDLSSVHATPGSHVDYVKELNEMFEGMNEDMFSKITQGTFKYNGKKGLQLVDEKNKVISDERIKSVFGNLFTKTEAYKDLLTQADFYADENNRITLGDEELTKDEFIQKKSAELLNGALSKYRSFQQDLSASTSWIPGYGSGDDKTELVRPYRTSGIMPGTGDSKKHATVIREPGLSQNLMPKGIFEFEKGEDGEQHLIFAEKKEPIEKLRRQNSNSSSPYEGYYDLLLDGASAFLNSDQGYQKYRKQKGDAKVGTFIEVMNDFFNKELDNLGLSKDNEHYIVIANRLKEYSKGKSTSPQKLMEKLASLRLIGDYDEFNAEVEKIENAISKDISRTSSNAYIDLRELLADFGIERGTFDSWDSEVADGFDKELPNIINNSFKTQQYRIKANNNSQTANTLKVFTKSLNDDNWEKIRVVDENSKEKSIDRIIPENIEEGSLSIGFLNGKPNVTFNYNTTDVYGDDKTYSVTMRSKRRSDSAMISNIKSLLKSSYKEIPIDSPDNVYESEDSNRILNPVESAEAVLDAWNELHLTKKDYKKLGELEQRGTIYFNGGDVVVSKLNRGYKIEEGGRESFVNRSELLDILLLEGFVGKDFERIFRAPRK